MAVINYRKFKISLRPDSKKTQGLQTGDIVRRQYFDGTNVVYSLMCVLSYGIDESVDATTNEVIRQSYFIGALLDGDGPQTEEILDFARMTNLFNQDRSGALYLTSSDSESPYMDVIDGIAKNCSLCWPVNVADTEYIDSTSQYVVLGDDAVEFSYQKALTEYSRICHIQRTTSAASGFIGLKQDFYQYISNPDCVLVSYRIKASTPCDLTVSLGYVDDVRIDGTINDEITTDWEYKFHVIQVDYSGRHLRSVKLDLSDMSLESDVWISDFNVILLSSVANFQDASQIRVGKLTGVVDPVFGRLDGYGSYLQKLYASNAAHISGTLTAGDENGFGATFYAGKIHRNAFVSSIDVNFNTEVTIDNIIANPTGIGKVYVSSGALEMVAQSKTWYNARIGKMYTFSFWGYFKKPCQLSILQNNQAVATIQVDEEDTHAWQRLHASFELLESSNSNQDLLLKLVPTFRNAEFDEISEDSEVIAIDEQVADESYYYFSAPQLESGRIVTQYQPTDTILNYTDEYGAWFNRGGIGGTMQNPLLQMNYDGEGSIGTRSKSLLLKQDGSGYLANENIQWDEDGKVTFGENVTLNWNNLDQSTREEMQGRSIRIIGPDTFTILGDMSTTDLSYAPASIELELEETNLQSTSSQRQWYYLNGNDYVRIPNANGRTLTILPTSSYWGNDNTLTIKCVITIGNKTYSDTTTIKKTVITGYTVEVVSEQGQTFKNGVCSTVLTANVYYQGKLVSPSYVEQNFTFLWKKYHLPDLEHEVQGWWEEVTDENDNVIREAIDRTASSIELEYDIYGQDLYICELQSGTMFPYGFPVIF